MERARVGVRVFTRVRFRVRLRCFVKLVFCSRLCGCLLCRWELAMGVLRLE